MILFHIYSQLRYTAAIFVLIEYNEQWFGLGPDIRERSRGFILMRTDYVNGHIWFRKNHREYKYQRISTRCQNFFTREITILNKMFFFINDLGLIKYIIKYLN